MHRKQLLKVYQDLEFRTIDSTSLCDPNWFIELYGAYFGYLTDTRQMFADHAIHIPPHLFNDDHYVRWDIFEDKLELMSYGNSRPVAELPHVMPEGCYV